MQRIELFFLEISYVMGYEVRSLESNLGPNLLREIFLDRYAPTGAIISRPWNVSETGW